MQCRISLFQQAISRLHIAALYTPSYDAYYVHHSHKQQQQKNQFLLKLHTALSQEQSRQDIVDHCVYLGTYCVLCTYRAHARTGEQYST